MSIITCKIPYNTETRNYDINCHGRQKKGSREIISIDYNKFEITIDSCSNYGCDHYVENNNDGPLGKIDKIVTNYYGYGGYGHDDKKSYKIQNKLNRIECLIKNNKYARIQHVLDNTDYNDYEKYNNIKEIIDDNKEYDSESLSDDSNSDAETETEITVLGKPPYITNFTKCDGYYFAKLHVTVSKYDISTVYITTNVLDDSYCCYGGTYEHHVAVQLCLSSPDKYNDKFESYGNAYVYKKNYNGNFTYEIYH